MPYRKYRYVGKSVLSKAGGGLTSNSVGRGGEFSSMRTATGLPMTMVAKYHVSKVRYIGKWMLSKAGHPTSVGSSYYSENFDISENRCYRKQATQLFLVLGWVGMYQTVRYIRSVADDPTKCWDIISIFSIYRNRYEYISEISTYRIINIECFDIYHIERESCKIA